MLWIFTSHNKENRHKSCASFQIRNDLLSREYNLPRPGFLLRKNLSRGFLVEHSLSGDLREPSEAEKIPRPKKAVPQKRELYSKKMLEKSKFRDFRNTVPSRLSSIRASRPGNAVARIAGRSSLLPDQ